MPAVSPRVLSRTRRQSWTRRPRDLRWWLQGGAKIHEKVGNRVRSKSSWDLPHNELPPPRSQHRCPSIFRRPYQSSRPQPRPSHTLERLPLSLLWVYWPSEAGPASNYRPESLSRTRIMGVCVEEGKRYRISIEYLRRKLKEENDKRGEKMLNKIVVKMNEKKVKVKNERDTERNRWHVILTAISWQSMRLIVVFAKGWTNMLFRSRSDGFSAFLCLLFSYAQRTVGKWKNRIFHGAEPCWLEFLRTAVIQFSVLYTDSSPPAL